MKPSTPKPTATPTTPTTPITPTTTAADPAMQGEGNYSATRRHRQATEAFVASGQVTKAARAAAPKTAAEAADLKRAEDAGKAPAKR